MEVGLLGIRGSFFPRPFGGSFQFRSYPYFIGEAADHNLQVDGVNFEFSDDQRLMRDQDRRFLDDNAPLRIARAILDDEALVYDADLWLSIAELWVDGGNHTRGIWRAGLIREDLRVIEEESGRSLAPTPFASSVYLATEAPLIAGGEDKMPRYLPELAGVKAIGCFAMAEGVRISLPATMTTTF